MKTEQWLSLFKEHNDINIFHINHLRLLTGMRSHSLRVNLSRLNAKKVIKRICREFYANPFNTPTLEEISNQIYQPSYISLESALYFWGILNQVPYVLTCVSTQPPRKFNTSFGTIEYRQIKKGFFWGFVDKGGYFIAEPEKALLDYLYLNKGRHIQLDLSEINLNEVNSAKIKFYAEKMGIKIDSYLHQLGSG
ncbi:hypothetical protein IBX65_01545 [Candidatus Aerophobetes bacterium]|nr:hypothetical protein [Candidatus Aerophobetes bacterium]